MRILRYILLLLIPLTISCSKEDVIPEETMVNLYYDMYMTDQYIPTDRKLSRESDSLLIYESIFNKYGYTFEDYNRSVYSYMERPAKFAKLFKEVQDRVSEREKVVKELIAKEEKLEKIRKIIPRLPYLSSDSLSGNGYYKALYTFYFEPVIPEIVSPVIDSSYYDIIYNVFFLYDKTPSCNDGFTVPMERVIIKQQKEDTINKKNINEKDFSKLSDYTERGDHKERLRFDRR